MRWSVVMVALVIGVVSLGSGVRGQAGEPAEVRPIGFAGVDRSIGALPEMVAAKPLYALFLFGLNGEKRVWAVLDKSESMLAHHDVLYLDRDADGKLGEEGERIAAASVKKREISGQEQVWVKFEIGSFVDPGSGVAHQKFSLTHRGDSFGYRMDWRGGKVTMGAYGPERATYANFGESPKTAPIVVPGWDRPFEFENWMSNELTVGEETEFKVFVGNRGDRTGAFSCVDDEFLPKEEYVLGTLIYEKVGGGQGKKQFKLKERC